MTGIYDPLLVILSFIVAAFGGYVALDLTSHARAARRWSGAWLAGASVALGAGIWSMHFIGMLALYTTHPVTYDIRLTALSFGLAVVMSGAGLFAMAWGKPGRLLLPVAGTLTGLGIVSMHYVGMAGMQMPARIIYDGRFVAASVVIAITASTTALWLAFHTVHSRQRLAGALLMGSAVVSMHYTGMAAASFVETAHHHTEHVEMAMIALALSPSYLAIGVGVGTIFLLSLALATALLDRRVEAERSAEREARYRSIFDTAVDPIVMLDERSIILSFNRAAEATFGYTAEEAVGASITLIVPETDRFSSNTKRCSPQPAGAPDGSQVVEACREMAGRRKDGSTFLVELSVSEWWVGRRHYFTGILRDITARKAAEDALRRAKEEAEQAKEEALSAKEFAERADMAKTKFLAAASHDLRQPLQSLFFFAHALSDRLENHPASPLLTSMNESLNGMRVLLDSLLDVSKLDAGVVTPNVTEFALGPLLDRLAAEYRGRAAETGIELRLVPTSAWTRSDPALLERILRNLIENAIRYTDKGRILLGCRWAGDVLRLSVADSGMGIPEEKREEIFQEFTQLGNPERNRRKGLGLGLAIVKRLCSLLDHRVTVQSRPGQGSVFTVELPLSAIRTLPKPRARATVQHVPDKAEAGEQVQGKELVVVVEDDAVILLSVRAMLEEWGYDVVAAMSAEEAIDTLLDLGRSPSMILADYRLREGRTGLQAIRDIFGLCGVRVPAVVLTGDTDPARIAEVQQSGCRLLHKPVTATMLREALSRAA